MKKIFKNPIFTFILGAVIFGSIGALAYSYTAKQVSFTPNDKNWNVKTVDEALTDLRANGTEDKICELKSGNALEIGSMYECNPSLDGATKYNFYVLKTEGNFVKLIMERNISDTIGSAKTVDWNTAMEFFRSGAGTSLNWKTQVELPRAQDIADAVRNTSWKTAEKDNNEWFCLENRKQDMLTSPYCYNNTQNTLWLWDYTRECTDWNCKNSLDSNYAYGYWIGDMVTKQTDTTIRAWQVNRSASFRGDDISILTGFGVRPVITVSKSNLSN